jgi:hypothetical protein
VLLSRTEKHPINPIYSLAGIHEFGNGHHLFKVFIMVDSCANRGAQYRDFAENHRLRGWSVIPIRGDSDPEQPKAAALNWTIYQSQRPTQVDIDSWFQDLNFTGLGVVCGAVSQLVVLDFDDADCWRAFARTCPDLLNTYTVRSGGRGLSHCYYRIPAGMHVRTRHTPGVDLQAEGAYVIAPPTVIDGKRWSPLVDLPPLELSASDLKRITTFLETYVYAISGQAETLVVDLPAVSQAGFDVDQLRGLYRNVAARMGRNAALFRIACLARDTGWTQAALQEALLLVHVSQPPNGQHPVEIPEQRRREGQQTIASAFRYPKRPLRQTPIAGLPNSVRESLLQTGQSAAARVLDGLRLAGIKAGALVTEKLMCHVLHVWGIGRRAVQAALKTITTLGQALFQEASAAEQSGHSNNCNLVTGANRVKTGGRPAQQFIVPANDQLYRILAVRPSNSDPLEPWALASPKDYRQALQQELLQRRPGHYSRRWLAARLGISIWTCRRYDHDLGLRVRATYYDQPLGWSDAEQLPQHVHRPNGTFLETADGRRYPPLRALALRLLRRGLHVTFKRQYWNYYEISCENYEVDSQAAQSADNLALPVPQIYCDEIHNLQEGEYIESIYMESPDKNLWVCQGCMTTHLGVEQPSTCFRCQQTRWEAVPATIWQDTERLKQWWQVRYQQHQRQHRPNTQADLAQKLYEQVRTRTPDQALTHRRARQLVADYGAEAVLQALARLRVCRQVRSAAGLVIATLQRGVGQSTDSDDHASWLARLQASPYAAYIDNSIVNSR